MIEQKIKLLIERYPGVNEAYIQVFGNNIPAIKSYEKAGFEIALEKNASLMETGEFMPYTSKVLMKRYIKTIL